MKLVFSILNQFSSSADITTVITRLVREDPIVKSNDMVFSILISSFVKPFLEKRADPTNSEDPLLVLACDLIIPKTLDVMADDAPHVLNITQQI